MAVKKVENSLMMAFLNACSIKVHITVVREYLSDSPSYHILHVVEKRLGRLVVDSLVSIGRYSIVRQDRNLQCSGVAFDSKDTLKCTQLVASNTTTSDKVVVLEHIMSHIRGMRENSTIIHFVLSFPIVS